MDEKKHAVGLILVVALSLYAGHRAYVYGEGLAEYYQAKFMCTWLEPRVMAADVDGGMNVLSALCWKNKILNAGNFKTKTPILADGKHEKVKRAEGKSTRRVVQEGSGRTKNRG